MFQLVNAFANAVNKVICSAKNNFAAVCCVIVLGQAYLPHGDHMKDYVDDLMDQLEEMFRSRRGKDEDSVDEDSIGHLDYTHLPYDPDKNRCRLGYLIQ